MKKSFYVFVVMVLLTACTFQSWKQDSDVQAARQDCANLSQGERYACIERQAVASLNPDVCRLAGMWIDDACLQAVYEAASDPGICDRLYLEGVRPNCYAYYTAISQMPAMPPGPTATSTSTPTWTVAPTPLPTATPVPTSTPTLTPTPTPTPAPTYTPDPYAGLTVADLSARAYGGGELRIEETLAVTGVFTRSLVAYPSDGLTAYGFMNVPQGQGPFPVVLVLHGYVNPARYYTLAYTTRYADALAGAGYLVIHPNFRNYPPSDEGPNPFRVGYAVDVLNLVALIRQQGGQPGPLEQAAPNVAGLLGHSMGGGIALRAITVSPHVGAAVLYGSMSGDERENYERILVWSGGQSGDQELATPEEALRRISPIYHLERVRAPVSIHHGEEDEVVPLEWSLDLCQRLQAMGKTVECFTYASQPHTFQGEGDQLFIQRMIAFFDQHLKSP